MLSKNSLTTEKLLGYHVRKGEEATGVDKNGNPTFTIDQTDETEDEQDYRDWLGLD